MKNKTFAILVLILLSATVVSANTGFSLTWENTFLTGKAILNGEEHDFYEFDENVKGGRVLFVFRYNLSENLSLGLGSGVSVSKLNASYEFWGINYFSTAMFYVPIFGEVRGQFPLYEDLLYVFGAARMGGSLAPLSIRMLFTDYSFDGGFFIEPTIGLSLNRGRFLLDLGIGYSHQKSQFVENYWRLPDDWDWDNDVPRVEVFEYYPFSLRQFSLNLGFGVFFGKK